MSDDKMREAFEAEFPPTIIIRFNRRKNTYEPDGEPYDEAEECAFNQQLQWEAWQAAQRQGGEAVACPGCDNEPEDRSHPERLCDDCKSILQTNTAPQPAVPEGWRSLIKRMRDDFDKLQRAVHFAGGFDPRYVSDARELIAEADGLLESAPQPDWIACSERLPPETVPVLGYNADWVDGDFNPKGVRECVLYGDGTQWMTARWCDAHDCWITTYDHEAIPTHWTNQPEPPGGNNE